MNEEQIKARLMNLAREQKKPFNDLLKPLSFERLLARVGHSQHRSKLIFKGGLCLKQFVNSDRETIDIDFLVKKVDSQVETIQKLFEEVLAIDMDDTFQFFLIDCTKLEVQHKKYPGYRIYIQANLGKTRDRLHVDLGVGDVVDELEMNLDVVQYKGNPLVSGAGISILAYPPEFIFSEKLQAIIELGSLNSRMKDYFDCYVLIIKDILDESRVKEAIAKTFKNRNTDIQAVEAASEEIMGVWTAFQKKIPTAPKAVEDVIKKINNYLINIKVIK